MLKNRKGYILSETIIAIATVATIITIIYTMSMGNYTKQNNELTKENTSQDLYAAYELRKFLYYQESDNIEEITSGTKNYTSIELNDDLINYMNIKYIYLSTYNLNNLLSIEVFNSMIKNSLKTKQSDDTNVNNCQYRYLIIYNDNSYSTLGIKCSNNS